MKHLVALLVLALMLIPSRSDATLLTGANHWAHTTLPARVGILINATARAQDVADGADAWTSSTLNYGVVGSASGSDCDGTPVGRQGFVVVCVGVVGASGSGTYTYIHSDCYWFLRGGGTSCTSAQTEHIASAVVYSSSLSPGTYVFCHELGHAIGQAHSGSGCMTAGASAACPSSTDLRESETNYAHVDDHDSAAPFGLFTVGGNANCGGPTPTPTASPVPTPTPVPTVTPIPNVCFHNPNNWKCH